MLARLFAYAKATGADAIENFTTEALAGAIRESPAPLLAALRTIGLDITEPIEPPETQVAVQGGQLDLLLIAGTKRIAVEIKVGAGESGDQLRRYVGWARTFSEALRPEIVVLSKQPLPGTHGLKWLSWQTLWNETKRAPIQTALWLDLARWLEETGMADDSFDPISPDEMGALRNTHSLMKKAVHIFAPACAELNRLWPRSDWPESEAETHRQLASRFATWPSLTVQHRESLKAGLTLGIEDGRAAGDAELAIWIWAPPRRLAERDRINERTRPLLSDGWQAGREWVVLRRSCTLPPPQPEATQWIIDRIQDLHATGVFDVLGSAGPAPPDALPNRGPG